MTAGTPTSREEAPRRRRAGALPGPIRVTLSDRAEDVDDALRVIHHGFVSAGYMEPRPSGRRMHPSYLNPDTRFAVARVGDHLAGTVAMVNDGPFGLPCERSFAEEVDDLRATGPVREVGSLVVDARWRRHTRHIYMHLLATLVRMALEGHPRQIYVLAVTPENARFTSGLFGCETMGEPRPLYGAPAVLLRTSHDRLRECYTHPSTPARRAMSQLVFDMDPEWLTVRVSGVSWPGCWLQPLLEEEGTARRLRNQLALLREADRG